MFGSGSEIIVDSSVIDGIDLPIGLGAGDGFSVDCNKKDIFAEHRQQSWKRNKLIRCDFKPHIHAVCRDTVWCMALWNISRQGRLLEEIKADGKEAVRFAETMAVLIRQWLGALDKEMWAVVTTPRRRHKEKNFATMVSEYLADIIDISFFPDVAVAKNKQRINPEFSLEYLPEQKNLLLVDDIITTGSTVKAMCNLLRSQNKTVLCIVGIDNRFDHARPEDNRGHQEMAV